MKLLIIRHGDPDYEHDTLTARGWQEAELLSERLVREPADYYYVSPLGRARDTASCTLKKLGVSAVECDWLREFQGQAYKPHCHGAAGIAWDWMPKDWTAEERFFRPEDWYEPESLSSLRIKDEYDYVCSRFDALLEEHGYRRCGRYYEAVRPNHDTLVFFCHFGLECVLLSHLMSVSPMPLWHGFCAAPTSVTTVYTEEREKGAAFFRAASFGDVTHLLSAGLQPSFSARFRECFDDPEE